MMQDRAILTMEGESETQAFEWYQFDLEISRFQG